MIVLGCHYGRSTYRARVERPLTGSQFRLMAASRPTAVAGNQGVHWTCLQLLWLR
jgi:hypothetical protein